MKNHNVQPFRKALTFVHFYAPIPLCSFLPLLNADKTVNQFGLQKIGFSKLNAALVKEG